MVKFATIVLLSLLSVEGYCQLPVQSWANEIGQLKTEQEINAYWSSIKTEDQQAINNFDSLIYDSVMQANLIKVSLMLEKHGFDSLSINNSTPISVFVHNNNPVSLLHCWKVVMAADSAVNNLRKRFNHEPMRPPSYPFDGLCTASYDYSIMYNEDSLIQVMAEALATSEARPDAKRLVNDYTEMGERRKLKTIATVGTWHRVPLKGMVMDDLFSIVKKSDNKYYYQYKVSGLQYLKKLTRKKTQHGWEFYQEANFLDWHYSLDHQGNLTLENNRGNLILTYPTAK